MKKIILLFIIIIGGILFGCFDVEANSNYEVIYDFDENMQTEYTKNEISSFGMIFFRKSGSINFNVDYEIKYHFIRGYEDSLSLLKKQFITHFAF